MSSGGRRSRAAANNGPCTTKGSPNSDLFALQKLDYLAFWAGHEGDASFHERVSAQDDGAWFDTARPPASCNSARVGGISVRHAHTKMQQGTFGTVLLRSPTSALSLDRGVRPEHLQVTAVADVEKSSAVYAPLDGELKTNRKAEALSIEPNRTIKIRSADRDVVKAEASAGTFHCLTRRAGDSSVK